MKQIFIGLDIAKTTGWAAVIFDCEKKVASAPLVGTEKIACQLDIMSLLVRLDAMFYSQGLPIIVICPEPTRFRDNYSKQFRMLGVIELWAESRNAEGHTTAVIVKVDNHMRKSVFGTIKYPVGLDKKQQRAFRKSLVMERYKDCAHNDDEADALMFIEYYTNYFKNND